MSGPVGATREVVVVGGGVIGLSSAWRLSAAGHRVTVVDPAPARGASYAAAGMLAPVTEATYQEEPLLRLGLAALEQWPAFADELHAATGLPTGLREAGTLVLAYDNDDRAELDRYVELTTRYGLAVQRLSGRECRELEPMLAPDIRAGALAPDRSVHNRLLLDALVRACERVGVEFLRRAARVVLSRGDVVTGVELDDGSVLASHHLVVCAGAYSGDLHGLPPAARPPVRPVRGSILRLSTPADYLSAGGVLHHTLRGLVQGWHVYLVPREDGEIVVGATSDEVGFDDRVTAGGVWELLRDARLLLPVVSELTFVEAWSGLRPASPDNGPLVGQGALEGLVIATGHGRGGVLLAPGTADAVVALVEGRDVPSGWGAFAPGRFPVAAGTVAR